MSQPVVMIAVRATPAELTALEIAAHVYQDLLEVVEPLKPDKTRTEVLKRLFSFQQRCEERKDSASADTLLLVQLPFNELMAVTTAIEVCRYLDTVYCLPGNFSVLTALEVMTLTQHFQRRLMSDALKN